MITYSRLKCPSCHMLFGFQNTPKILKNCQHTLCINCLKTQKSCPIDSIDINVNKWGLKSFLTNTSILEEIQNDGKTTRQIMHGQIFSSSNNLSKKEPNKLFQSKTELSNWQICKVHAQKASYICKQDHSIICPLCMTLSPHQSHSTISYEQLLKKLTEFTDQTYIIFQSLNVHSQKLTKRKIDNFIECQLLKKKEKQAFYIRSYFQSIIEKIRKQEKQVLNLLDEILNESVKGLKGNIMVNEAQNRKDLWTQQLHKLTSVMEDIYGWTGFQNALQYLNEHNQKSRLINKGDHLVNEFIHLGEVIKNAVNQQGKLIQCTFDERLLKSINNLCTFNSKINLSQQNNISIQTQYQPQQQLTIQQQYSQSFQFTQQSNTYPSSQDQLSKSLSQQSQDFLLDTQKSYQHHQTLPKNEITFDQNFSLVQQIDSQKQPFTPILRKQQDSISALQEESTVINLKNHKKDKQSTSLKKGQSEDITVDLSQTNKYVSLSNLKINNQTTQLSRTLIRQRSPLKNIFNNSQSKQRKNEIPQKYMQMWQRAKQDRNQLIDLTGAQLGDTTILHLCNNLWESQKIKSLKLIRNKLTDEIFYDLIDCVRRTNISSINLSQNAFTQKVLDVLDQMELGNLKSITLSLNKIVLRKVKDRIERFKQKGITLTV